MELEKNATNYEAWEMAGDNLSRWKVVAYKFTNRNNSTMIQIHLKSHIIALKSLCYSTYLTPVKTSFLKDSFMLNSL